MVMTDTIMLGGFILTLLTVFYNIVKTSTIKNNDLHHVGKDLAEIKESLSLACEERKALSQGIAECRTRVAGIESSLDICQGMHLKKTKPSKRRIK